MYNNYIHTWIFHKYPHACCQEIPATFYFSKLDKLLQNGQHWDWPWSKNAWKKTYPMISLRPKHVLPKTKQYMGIGRNLVPLVNIKIAGKWMFIPLKMVLIGIDPYPYKLSISCMASNEMSRNLWVGKGWNGEMWWAPLRKGSWAPRKKHRSIWQCYANFPRFFAHVPGSSGHFKSIQRPNNT